MFEADKKVDLHFASRLDLPFGQRMLLEEYPVNSCLAENVEVLRIVEVSDSIWRTLCGMRRLRFKLYDTGDYAGNCIQWDQGGVPEEEIDPNLKQFLPLSTEPNAEDEATS